MEGSATSGRTYGGRPAGERRAIRRERLVAAAYALFGTRGFEATPIRALCREAGVAVRYFYEEHGSREALLLAAYERVIDDVDRAVVEAVAGAPPALDGRLTAGIAAFVRAMTEDERRARIAYVEVRRPELAERRFAAVERLRDRTLALVVASEGLGVDPDDPELPALVLALIGASNATVEQWVETPVERRPPPTALVSVLRRAYLAVLAGGR